MKVSTQHKCPDAETLTAFDSGKLAESEFKPVAEHIEGCRECQAQLEQANAGSGFAAMLRSAAEHSDVKPLVDSAARGGNSKLVKNLLDLGVIDHDQATITCGRQDDSDSLKELLRAGAVTKFQARSITKGKAAGLRLGDYIICDKLGEGGMGLVYKAEHRRMQRTVAIKLLPASATASRDAVRRFQREAQAAAKLIHRNVVTAYDAGEDQGRHFLVMEYVDGESLSSMVRSRGPLPVAEAWDYVRQTASALEYAHSQRIVHRDIKPGNILVDRQGVVKLLDLGLARIGNVASEPNSDDLTRTGQVMGTVDYMAPEQARSSRMADHRADIYSLGCTLYFLLTGRPPFRGDNPVETLLAHAEQPIPPLRPDISRDLAAVNYRMLAKDPAERYQSVAELIAALDVLDRVPSTVPAAPPLPDDSQNDETLPYLEQASVDTLQAAPIAVKARKKPTAKQLRSARRSNRRIQWVALGLGGLAILLLLTIVIVISNKGKTTITVDEQGGKTNVVIVAVDEPTEVEAARKSPRQTPAARSVDDPEPAAGDEAVDEPTEVEAADKLPGPTPTARPANDPEPTADEEAEIASPKTDPAKANKAAEKEETTQPAAPAGNQMSDEINIIKRDIERRKQAGEFGRPPDVKRMEEAAKREIADRQKDGRLPANRTMRLRYASNGAVFFTWYSGNIPRGFQKNTKQQTPQGTQLKQPNDATNPSPTGKAPADFKLTIHKGVRPVEETNFEKASKILIATWMSYNRKNFEFEATIEANGQRQRFTHPRKAWEAYGAVARQAGIWRGGGGGGGIGGGGGFGGGGGKGAVKRAGEASNLAGLTTKSVERLFQSFFSL